jgi:hypothetical protein
VSEHDINKGIVGKIGEIIHGLGLVLEEAHGVLYKDFVLEADEFDDFFSDPGANDLQIYFAHVYLEYICCLTGG